MNKKESQLKLTKLKQENRQDYFLRFAYFVAGIQNTKKEQIRESP